MIAILYSLLFVSLLYFYRRKNGNCVGTWLLLWYAIASALTVWEYYTTPINSTYLDEIATIYYASCQLIALTPFLILAKYDCRKFQYCEELFTYLAYVLVVFGIYKLVISIGDLYNNISILFGDIAQMRYAFYDRFMESKSISSFEKLTIIVNNLSYMTPFLAFYFLAKGKNRLSTLLFFASLGMPLGQMAHGEREGSLKYIVNIYFCYLFFKPVLSEVIKNKVKKIGAGTLVLFVIFIVAMTIGRFGGSSGNGVRDSLFLYGGDQPFLFTTFFNDQNLINQAQGGRINFQYFFPVVERVQGQINLYIDSDIYLNQFAGMPGSFFLDFGFNAILVIALISFFYLMVIKRSKKNEEGCYPVHVLFLFVFSFQVLFMNIFYYDFCSLFDVLFTVTFYFVCLFYKGKKENICSL